MSGGWQIRVLESWLFTCRLSKECLIASDFLISLFLVLERFQPLAKNSFPFQGGIHPETLLTRSWYLSVFAYKTIHGLCNLLDMRNASPPQSTYLTLYSTLSFESELIQRLCKVQLPPLHKSVRKLLWESSRIIRAAWQNVNRRLTLDLNALQGCYWCTSELIVADCHAYSLSISLNHFWSCFPLSYSMEFLELFLH